MDSELAQHLRAELEMALDQIRPALIADGGNVELVGFDDSGAVSLVFQGSCVGCPSQNATVRALLEPLLKKRVPSVSTIVTIDPDAQLPRPD